MTRVGSQRHSKKRRRRKEKEMGNLQTCAIRFKFTFRIIEQAECK